MNSTGKKYKARNGATGFHLQMEQSWYCYTPHFPCKPHAGKGEASCPKWTVRATDI